ncbi:MAG TPA: cyclic nucleotide-binding domain-containing protein [Thermoanaerobaculia bacterium]|nr:cyclic nucleotide-binding domain-containing protein [Thermoanaerobaculia bacterium]
MSTADVGGVHCARRGRGLAGRAREEARRVAFKSWFRGGGGGGQQPQQDYTIDDLIVLEHYEEAEQRLRARLRSNPEDLHSRLKIAEVYAQLRQYDKAVEEYSLVAEEYAQDGFYEKGVALLAKAQKLAPLDPSIRFKVERYQREKSMEHVRALAIEGLRQAGGQQAGTSAVELQRLWHNLAGSRIVQRLTPEQLKRLLSTMQLLHWKAGTPVAEEGSREAQLLLIVRGVIEAFVGGDGEPPLGVRGFTSGDVVGEGVLLERGAWPASYRVAEDATVLKLTREGLEQNLVGNSDPRAFLEALREQHHDRDVGVAVRRLRSGG